MHQLSPIDAAMVFMETPRTPFHVSMVNVFDPSTCPGDPPTFDDIVEAIRGSLPVAPTFRRRLVRVPFDLDYPYWIEDADFDLDYHMRHIALPSPGDWAQFRSQVARLVARPLDLTRPPWEMTVIEGLDGIEGFPKGCFATVLKVHHGAIDGMAGVELINAIHQMSPHDRPRKHLDRWRPEPIPTAAQLLRGAWLHSITRPVAIGRLVLQNASTLAREAFDELRGDEEDEDAHEVPKVSLNGPISAQRVWDDVGCELADLKRTRKAVEGATINDVCLAILGGALRRYLQARNELPEESLVTMVPISTRTPEQAKDGGNQLSLMRAALFTQIADPIERLEAIAQQTQEKKAVQDGVVMPILLEVVDNLPGALLGIASRAIPLAGPRIGEMKPVCNTMLTNVPGPPTPYYLLGAQCVHTTGCPPLMDGAGVLNAVHSYAGRVVFTFTGCPTLLDDSDLYRDCLRDSIQELVTAASA